MEDAPAVQVVDGRAEVEAQVGHLLYGQPAVARVYEVRQGLAGEGLHDQDGRRPLYPLVEPRYVGVREVPEERPLAQQPRGHVLAL